MFRQFAIFFSGQHRHTLIDTSLAICCLIVAARAYRLLFAGISMNAVNQSGELPQINLFNILPEQLTPLNSSQFPFLCLYAISYIGFIKLKHDI
ncbi:MAG TPA: hypothetical protein VIF37_05095 [Methylobacter sp.]